jgi:hypothetical protein
MYNTKAYLEQQKRILQQFSLNWPTATDMLLRQSSRQNVLVGKLERLMCKNTVRLSGFLLLMGILFSPERANAVQDLALIDCEQWCVGTSNCVACSTISDCGSYYTDINTFRRGSGWDWHACRARASNYGRRSEEKRRECIQYCQENWQYCDMCSTYSNCGQDYTTLRSFTGTGRNWYACQSDRMNTTRPPKSLENIDFEKIYNGTVSIPGW